MKFFIFICFKFFFRLFVSLHAFTTNITPLTRAMQVLPEEKLLSTHTEGGELTVVAPSQERIHLKWIDLVPMLPVGLPNLSSRLVSAEELSFRCVPSALPSLRTLKRKNFYWYPCQTLNPSRKKYFRTLYCSTSLLYKIMVCFHHIR